MKEYYVLPGSLPGQILWHAKGNPEYKTFVNCDRIKQRKKNDVHGNRRNLIVKNRVLQRDKTKKLRKSCRE